MSNLQLPESIYFQALVQAVPIALPQPQVIIDGVKVIIGGLTTIGVLEKLRQWWEARKLETLWSVDCSIHVIGTPNHEVDRRLTWFVRAPDAETARSLATQMNDARVTRNYAAG